MSKNLLTNLKFLHRPDKVPAIIPHDTGDMHPSGPLVMASDQRDRGELSPLYRSGGTGSSPASTERAAAGQIFPVISTMVWPAIIQQYLQIILRLTDPRSNGYTAEFAGSNQREAIRKYDWWSQREYWQQAGLSSRGQLW